MAIGRISGSMLKSNLTRNGVDLAFETNILYLDVTNARVGIGTSEPSSALQVVGTITTNTLRTIGEDSTTYGLTIEGNNISTTSSNSDIVLNPSGTGHVDVSSSRIINVVDPSGNQDAATKKYVDDQIIASGSGTVVSIEAGAGLTASPSNPITTSGTISLDFSTVVARVVGDDSTGTDLRVGETIKIAGSNGIITAVSGDTLTITGTGAAQGLTFLGDDSTGTAVPDGGTVQVVGGNNIDATVSGNVVTITGSKDINVNSITSDDSTAIQINDSMNASGTITAASFVTHGSGGSITGVNNLEVNQISSADSSAIQINDNINISGTLNAKTIVTNDLISEDSTAINVLDGLNVTGDLSIGGGDITVPSGNLTITTPSLGNQLILNPNGSAVDIGNLFGLGTVIVRDITYFQKNVEITGNLNVNSIASGDSSAIQINDALNVSGTINVQGNLIQGVQDPTNAQDAATKNYVDTRISATNSLTVGGDDSSEITLDLDTTLNVKGGTNISTSTSGDTLTITGATDLIVNSLESADSTAIQVNDSMNASGTITAASFVTHGSGGSITGVNNLEVNQISSADSSAIQINDNVNVAGTINVQGNLIQGVQDPSSAQDAATKNYVDTQLSSYTPSGSGITFVGDDSTGDTVLLGDTLRITGSGSITTAVSSEGVLTITGANAALGLTFIGDDSTGTAVPDGGTLQIVGGEGIDTTVLGNVLTITNTSTQLEIDGGSAYSVYNAISEALIDGGSA